MSPVLGARGFLAHAWRGSLQTREKSAPRGGGARRNGPHPAASATRWVRVIFTRKLASTHLACLSGHGQMLESAVTLGPGRSPKTNRNSDLIFQRPGCTLRRVRLTVMSWGSSQQHPVGLSLVATAIDASSPSPTIGNVRRDIQCPPRQGPNVPHQRHQPSPAQRHASVRVFRTTTRRAVWAPRMRW